MEPKCSIFNIEDISSYIEAACKEHTTVSFLIVNMGAEAEGFVSQSWYRGIYLHPCIVGEMLSWWQWLQFHLRSPLLTVTYGKMALQHGENSVFIGLLPPEFLQFLQLVPADLEQLFDSFAQAVTTLTSAERRILNYYIKGCEITDIPDLAFISINTVKKHNRSIYHKLNVASRDELMLYIEQFRRWGRLDELTGAVQKA